jgi:hypothetical protein
MSPDMFIEYCSIGWFACFLPVYPIHIAYERYSTVQECLCFEPWYYFPSFDKATSLEKLTCLAVCEESGVVFIDC